MEIKIVIPGRPVGKARPRVTYHGTYTPKKTKEYEEHVMGCWFEQSGGVIGDGVPIEAEIHAYFIPPKSVSKKKYAEMLGKEYTKKPDTDNIVKAILDGLQGFAFREDARIYKVMAEKRYSEEERVEVVLRYGD